MSDELSNRPSDVKGGEVMVAGALEVALRSFNNAEGEYIDVETLLDGDGQVTGDLLIRVPFMKSSYRLTISREPGTEIEL